MQVKQSPAMKDGITRLVARIREILTPANLISLSVPIGVLIACTVLPLKTTIRQAMVGVLLIWFGVEIMTYR
jgi:hypothetical protein